MTLTAEEKQEITNHVENSETVRDLMNVIFAEANNVERLKETMIAYTKNLHKHNPEHSLEECEKAAKSNISYLLGYYSDNEDVTRIRATLELLPVFLGGVEVITY